MTDIDHLVGEFDAYKWADGWLATLAEHPEIATDRETMHTWFVNVLMSGHDHGVEEERKRPLLEKIHEVIFQAAGAATAPLLEDHGDYVFPSERVVANIERVLTEFGIPADRHDWALVSAAVPREQGYRGDPGPMTDRLDRATHAEMAPPDPKRSAYHNPPTEEER